MTPTSDAATESSPTCSTFDRLLGAADRLDLANEALEGADTFSDLIKSARASVSDVADLERKLTQVERLIVSTKGKLSGTERKVLNLVKQLRSQADALARSMDQNNVEQLVAGSRARARAQRQILRKMDSLDRQSQKVIERASDLDTRVTEMLERKQILEELSVNERALLSETFIEQRKRVRGDLKVRQAEMELRILEGLSNTLFPVIHNHFLSSAWVD